MPLTDVPKKSLIDCHVHLAALPEGNNGCLISSKDVEEPPLPLLIMETPAFPN